MKFGGEMISDAHVTVTCDRCGYTEEYDLTATAGGGWDDRYMTDRLERDGWRVEGGSHICEDCVEAELRTGAVKTKTG
jgi:RNase P subunit RPR2